MKIVETAIATTGIFLAISLTPHTASSQDQIPPGCRVDGESIIAELQKIHGEEVKAIGLTAQGNLVRWLANDENGSWSMVTTMPARPDGTAPGCLNVHGGFWEIMLPAPQGPAS
jgi:hypothetical protein